MSDKINKKHFELTRELIDEIREAIANNKIEKVREMFANMHPVDVAEIYDELNIDEAKYVHLLLPPELGSEVISELDEEVRDRFLKVLPGHIIADKVIKNIESDDAADIIADLPEEKQADVLSNIKNVKQASDIIDLLNYEEDTAGGLMAKELVVVNKNLTIRECLIHLRKQAEKVKNIYYIYVVDNDNKLVGTLSLKKLLLADSHKRVIDICNTDVIAVHTDTDDEEVANLMHKYNLIALPVIDSIGRLVGKITIDDVVDVIKEEAEKDYQMMSGITEDVESSDSVFKLTRARLPWLVIGLFGELLGSRVIGVFEADIVKYAGLALFMPLIAAMGGNSGVQSSSIIVQSIASGNLGIESIWKKIGKESLIAIINGLFLSLIVAIFTYTFQTSWILSLSISIALLSVIIFASLFGIIVPLVLHKMNIDPAVATGPFITTSNDILGFLIYFSIARMIFSIYG
jgi:magnesium transporter